MLGNTRVWETAFEKVFTFRMNGMLFKSQISMYYDTCLLFFFSTLSNSKALQDHVQHKAVTIPIHCRHVQF